MAEPWRFVGISVIGTVTLDQPIDLLATAPIDPASIASTTVAVLATGGPGAGSLPAGTFAVVGIDADRQDQVLRFLPQLPTGTDPLATGLRPETQYTIHLPARGLRARDGRALAEDQRFTFTTVAGSTPGELFSRGRPGGPQVTTLGATPLDDDQRWQLGRHAQGPTELRVSFNQPLDPTADNLPRTSTAAAPSSIWLSYVDPERGLTTIPTDLELERNHQDGATVLLTPHGVLPNAAVIAVRVRGGLRDLAGEVLGGSDPTIATLRTEPAWPPQFSALVERFVDDRVLDRDADFREPEATLANGRLTAAPVFPGSPALGDWRAEFAETVIDTNRQELTLTNGNRVPFLGGVIRVRHLQVPAGMVVRGRGPNPLVFVVDGNADIEGTITVGGDSAPFPVLTRQYRGPGDITPPRAGLGGGAVLGTSFGGGGQCGGGDGGRSGAWLGQRAISGEAGAAAGGRAGDGGQPGRLGCEAGCGRGSGGGGGAFATQGDPDVPELDPTRFPQRLGTGGQGCAGAPGSTTRNLPGGNPGMPVFVDALTSNDHWGALWNPIQGRRVHGELRAPRGGAGGGGGGNLSNASGCDPNTPFWFNDSNGGGGGGGGGVLLLQVRGRVTIHPGGRLIADGGHGHGGDQNGSANEGGGGGGGSGGMVVVMAGERIVLHTHGETFVNRDYDFAISADGGVCRTGTFGSPVVAGKYPGNGEEMLSGLLYNAAPLGGFGGLGVIQLMAPPGTGNADGTNTVLDDRIDVIRAGEALTGADKQRFLGWRGLPRTDGVRVDDFGQPVGLGHGVGDLRPAPILMPVPWGPVSRARSRWLPIGAATRRPLSQPDGQPRGVVTDANTPVGPDFTLPTTPDGWLRFDNRGGSLVLADERLLGSAAEVRASQANATRAGRAVYELELQQPVLGSQPDRYSGYVAELLDAGNQTLGRFRIQGHDADTVWLEPDGALPASIAALQLRAGLIDLQPAPIPGYFDHAGQLTPRSNARIGFAFHRDPTLAAPTGQDSRRFPPTVGEYLHDLGDPTTAAALRAFGATHVSWDVTFDQTFRRVPADQPPPPNDLTQMHLRAIWLPFRF
ncbi:MAG: hypothetical protein IPK26_22160 [Planctomycetes bacterium]|nr:hypothetical protein [Planctomycetota bacterium]